MSIKITRKKKLYPNMWVMECPRCGRYCASGDNPDMLPEFTTCECD